MDLAEATPGQKLRWQRAIDLVSLAAGEDNDCVMGGQACAAMEPSDAYLMVPALVGLAASLADCLAYVTGRDVNDVLCEMR